MAKAHDRTPSVIASGNGRRYDMGRIQAEFKVDGAQTDGKYSVSEWWLDPRTKGPGAHSHDTEDEIFFVIEGVITFLVGDTWRDVAKGGVVHVPAGIPHDFENRSRRKAGVLNCFIGSAFEPGMPAIVDWFRENPPESIDPTTSPAAPAN
ncbi:cupin domain-containing protein [uncultured Roseibium sp.]|uniref:cupin domain-containing protein n=1 Tax=uncultured Roseibium sp. TaxID=1936171 RepID=UPI002605CFA0|nr:cupin domain-containing protein [uncultured Roseibium sp.]